MTHRANRLLAVALGAAAIHLWSPIVRADDDPNVELMKKLYTKIGQSVGVGSNNPQTGESFLILLNPGILLDPNLDYTTPDGEYTLSQVIDKVIQPSWVYKAGSNGTFDIYNNILNYHEAAVVNPTPGQKQQYKTACKIIYTDCDQDLPGTPTQAFTHYQDLMGTLATAAKAAEDYQRINHTNDLPPDIKNNLRVATQNLQLFGQKVRIEGAMATINTFDHIDPNAWWGELQGKFNDNSLTYSGNHYGNYNLYPSYPVWLDMNRSWSKLTLSQSDIEQTVTNSHSSVGGGLSGGWGLWSFSADYQHQENRSYFKLDASGMSVSMNSCGLF